jgi:tetratricopeptide (TPR) repeat protein
MGSKLVEIALHYRDLLEQAAVTTSADPQVAALKKQIRLALEAPDLKRADALLAKVQEIEDAAADRMALEAAATASQRAQIALTRLRYRDAARLFSKAAARVPPDYDQQRRDYLDRQADALYRQGDEKGDNAAIGEAILAYRDLVAQRPRERVPLDWAMTQNNLGNALWTLGARESGTARLKEAKSCIENAWHV